MLGWRMSWKGSSSGQPAWSESACASRDGSLLDILRVVASQIVVS